jgi:hypothetical protein
LPEPVTEGFEVSLQKVRMNNLYLIGRKRFLEMGYRPWINLYGDEMRNLSRKVLREHALTRADFNHHVASCGV